MRLNGHPVYRLRLYKVIKLEIKWFWQEINCGFVLPTIFHLNKLVSHFNILIFFRPNHRNDGTREKKKYDKDFE